MTTRRLVTNVLSTEIIAGPYGRAVTASVGARVLKTDAAKFNALSARLGRTPGQLLRELVQLSVSDPAALISQVATLLELPKDALPSEVLDFLQRLIDEIGTPAAGAEAMVDSAEVPAPPGNPVGLSVAQAAALKRRNLPITLAAWKTLTASVVRTTDSAPAPAAAAPTKPAVTCPAPFTAAEQRLLARENIAPKEGRAFLAARAAKAAKRST